MLTDDVIPGMAEKKSFELVNFAYFNTRKIDNKTKITDEKEITIYVPAFDENKMFKKTFKSQKGFTLRDLIEKFYSCAGQAMWIDIKTNPKKYKKISPDTGRQQVKTLTDKYAVNHYFHNDNNFYTEYVLPSVTKYQLINKSPKEYGYMWMNKINDDMKNLKDTDKILIHTSEMYINFRIFDDEFHTKKFESPTGFTLESIIRAVRDTGKEAYEMDIINHPEHYNKNYIKAITAEECIGNTSLVDLKITDLNQIEPYLEG